ncbi:prostaglandin E receptor 2a (subtype EP2) [Gambusia affinis]|uniref:prostaglandin E receptor 2a (subtype EP2) n=1 Tax=Gambusia affinis TaxID=33528 RepID=UPI001CDBF16B|nr:prostaglandin E receptor 2a (subtype EP2) [Gambusia affinis]XP_043966035.1 prostaglandin E receptor 2a (subtype EP2) [Gambusia affinis]
MEKNKYTICHSEDDIEHDESPKISAIMFGLGVFGNVAALVILEIRRRRDSRADDRRHRGLFHIFINFLVFTDLTGTCLTSPVVQIAYAWNKTLVGLAPTCINAINNFSGAVDSCTSSASNNCSSSVCKYFGSSMTFFSLATISLLFITALDKCFAIGHPYLYNRVVTKKWAYITISVMFLVCFLFCLLPFVKFGAYVQYCPGTWCFIDMNPCDIKHRIYANLYATIMLVLVLSIVACNGFVGCQLFRMYRRRNRQGSVMKSMRSSSERRVFVAHEVEHLIPLVFMTIIFIICTLPMVIRVFYNSIRTEEEYHEHDLLALRFLSINSIIDPWVFILLSPSVLHFFCLSVCKSRLGKFRGSVSETTLAKDNRHAPVELSRTTMWTGCPPVEETV